jgi:hypothetical protein
VQRNTKEKTRKNVKKTQHRVQSARGDIERLRDKKGERKS